MKNMTHYLSGLLALIMISLPVHSGVNSVSPSPGSVTVPVQGTNTLNIIWRVNRTADRAGALTVSVSSPNAFLYINGSAVATIAGSLSQNSTLAPGLSATLNIPEVITLNAAQSKLIANAASGSVSIRRVFDDTQLGSASGLLPVYAGANTTGELDIQRIDLKFINEQRTAVIGKFTRKQAIAEIAYRGNGTIKAEWRISEPSSTLGNAQGRILEVVRRQLVSAGQGKSIIMSPMLPTNRNGLHLVTLYIEQADGAIEIPVLRYFVLDDDGSSKPKNIETYTPGPNTELTGKTTFSWPQVLGAAAYEIQIFPTNDDIPITGKMVTSESLKMTLSSFTLEQLAPGQGYEWQLRALNKNGQVIGVSSRQRLRR